MTVRRLRRRARRKALSRGIVFLLTTRPGRAALAWRLRQERETIARGVAVGTLLGLVVLTLAAERERARHG